MQVPLPLLLERIPAGRYLYTAFLGQSKERVILAEGTNHWCLRIRNAQPVG